MIDIERFRRVLGETIAWCSQSPEPGGDHDVLRSDRWRPCVLWSAAANVAMLGDQRGQHSRIAAAPSEDLRGGRLLVFWPQQSLFDGAAGVESGGFYDGFNCPPWDTWVHHISPVPRPEPPFDSEAVVSFVPARWVDAAERGLLVNMEGCLAWLADTRIDLAVQLRTLGWSF